jgi:hypothetical protein
MSSCSDIVAIDRVKWIEGSKQTKAIYFLSDAPQCAPHTISSASRRSFRLSLMK